MTSSYSRSPKLLKGAFVELSRRFAGAVPNVIAFQYNPETLERSFTASAADEGGEDADLTEEALAMALPGDPVESIRMTLRLDATDDLEAGRAVAEQVGVGDRLAAIEKLLYPEPGEGAALLDDVAPALGGLLGGDAIAERTRAPVVLFAWGPGRVVPVRLTDFSIEEQAFSTTLYPVRADVSVTLRILRPAAFGQAEEHGESLAVTAYRYTKKQKEVLAAMNQTGQADVILGLLRF